MQPLKKDLFLQKDIPTEQSNRVKYHHLSAQNSNLLLTVSQLEKQIESLRKINNQLLHKSPKSIQILIEQLTYQNHHLQLSLFRILKNNQQLSCDILMKNQLLCEAQRQHREMIDNYDEKIYQLRISLQNKESTVSAMEDKMNQLKQDTYGSTSRVNLMYYNEINELKAMLDRLNVQNSQLRFLNAVKDEQIQRMRVLIEKYDKAMQKREDWKKFKQTIVNAQAACQQTKNKKQQARNKLQQQLTRYDMKYKNLSSTKNLNTTNQINNLKFIITHLSKQNRDLLTQKTKIQNNLKIKDKQYRMIQQAYKKIKTQLIVDKIQIQFYRDNFKELNKVTAQRKIKYYDQYYEQLLPNLQRKLKEKQSVITYWKHWQKYNKQYIQRSIFTPSDTKRKPSKRSSSCSSTFSHINESPKRKICPKQKQQAIFSFINQTHNVDSLVNYTIDAQHHPKEEEKIFNDDISVIIKPKIIPEKPHRKKKEIG